MPESIGNGWFGPGQCEENCCGPPTPCEKPIVTCKKFDDGPYTVSKFVYTVENATEAWITENCTGPYGEVTSVRHEVELDEDGNAEGEYYTLSNCKYCINALNACGIVFCCDVCDTPRCFFDSVVRLPDGSVRINWRYSSNYVVIPGGSESGGGDPIVIATLNGVDILGDPNGDSGELYIARVDLPDVIRMVLVNDCGKTAVCEYPVPCCWKKSKIRYSFSGMNDISLSCSKGPVTGSPSAPSWIYIYRQESILAITGLAALNGTYIFDTDEPGSCAITNQLELIGSAQYYEKQYFDVDQLLGSGTVLRRERQYEFSGTVSIFIDKATGALYFRQPSSGMRSWGFRKINGVHENASPLNPSPFDIQVCFGPPTNCGLVSPPCPPCNIGLFSLPNKACGSEIVNNLVFGTSYRQMLEAEIFGFACPFPSTVNNGTLEIEYLV